MSTTKLRMKMGQVEVEYEGSEQFLKDEVPALMSAVADLRASSTGDDEDDGAGSAADTTNPGAAAQGGTLTGTTATLAGKLKVNSGPELILAACARLTMVRGEPQFKRKQILDEMRSASGYFKSSYSDNLSKYLKTLVKSGSLVEVSQGVYALNATKREQLEKQLA